MNNPLNIFIVTSVTLVLAYRAIDIVRESVAETAPSTIERKLPAVVLEGAVLASGRLLVLLGTALVITCVIAIARETSLRTSAVTPKAGIIRLEPIVVSIPAARFDAIRAEEVGATRLAVSPLVTRRTHG